MRFPGQGSMTTGPQKVCVREKHMRGLGGTAGTFQGHLVFSLPVLEAGMT